MTKQIEEIKELTNELVFTSNYGTYNAVAEYLHNKGYRKASDVAREIFEEIDKLFSSRMLYDGTKFFIPYYLEGLKDDITELKKKYESEGVDDEKSC